ncbi:MAG: hypothetical protein JO015_06400 [Verrucomicrobia bacterium]|nr:hypothetical protein [Verrucomicrobiota bacterium]
MHQRFYKPALTSRPALAVTAFVVSFLLLFASGRMSSGDATEQLRVALLIVNKGTLSSPEEIPAWIQGPDHRYYEPHDLGNTVLMLPAALLGSCLSKGTAADKIASPPVLTRIGVAFTYAIFSAIGALLVYQLFALTFSTRTAFLLSAGFVMTTMYWPYSKTAWDVMGGCVCMCALLYLCGKIPLVPRPRLYVILAAAAFALACTFRYSLGIFAGLAFAVYLFLQRRKVRFSDYLMSALTGFTVLVPTFAYNWLRMGNPLRPGTTAPVYLNGNNALNGNVFHGLFGLFFAPNRGLFLYSPVLLLIFLLPFYWKHVPRPTRGLVLTFLPGALLYSLLIARMQNWGAFGWGPRYLLPVLPIFGVAVAPVAVALWRSRFRPAFAALVIASAALTVPPVLVNWHLATVESETAWNQDVGFPSQQIAVWHGLWLGIHGKPLPVSQKSREAAEDPARSGANRFPDFWLVRLGEHSAGGRIVAWAITLMLLSINGAALAGIFRRPDRSGDAVQGTRPPKTAQVKTATVGT